MRIESYQDKLQRRQYEESGGYHRLFLERPWHPMGLRYILALRLLRDVEGQRCLDCGGGDGAMATLLADRGARAVVADPLRAALIWAEVDGRLDNIQAATLMPFENKSFEAVAMLDVLEHIPSSGEGLILEEVFRLLTDQGRLVISVPSIKNPNPVGGKHYRHYSLGDLQDKLGRAGFASERTVPFRRLLPNLVGKGIGPVPVGKVIRGLAYLGDHLMRGVNGRMGLVECLPHQADSFVVLARKKGLTS